MADSKIEVTIREYKATNFARVKELMLKAENFALGLAVALRGFNQRKG